MDTLSNTAPPLLLRTISTPAPVDMIDSVDLQHLIDVALRTPLDQGRRRGHTFVSRRRVHRLRQFLFGTYMTAQWAPPRTTLICQPAAVARLLKLRRCLRSGVRLCHRRLLRRTLATVRRILVWYLPDHLVQHCIGPYILRQ